MNIKVLKVAPGQAPERITMPNTLEAFQEAVGGYIETVGLDANAVLVCNEEGKLSGLPANRQVPGRSSSWVRRMGTSAPFPMGTQRTTQAGLRNPCLSRKAPQPGNFTCSKGGNHAKDNSQRPGGR